LNKNRIVRGVKINSAVGFCLGLNQLLGDQVFGGHQHLGLLCTQQLCRAAKAHVDGAQKARSGYLRHHPRRNTVWAGTATSR
jgi:hypothetical protein